MTGKFGARVGAAAWLLGLSLVGPQPGVAAADGPDADSPSSATESPGSPSDGAAGEAKTGPSRRGVGPIGAQHRGKVQAPDRLEAPPRRGPRMASTVRSEDPGPSVRNTAELQRISAVTVQQRPGSEPPLSLGEVLVPAASALLPRASGVVGVPAPPEAASVVASSQSSPASGCAACWGAGAPSLGAAINTVINHVFNSAFEWSSTLPGGPLSNLLEGALVLVRRSLFLSPEGVSADLVGNSLSVSVNPGSVAYVRQVGSRLQVSGDPWFRRAQSLDTALVSSVAVANKAVDSGCAGLVVQSGVFRGSSPDLLISLQTSQIDSLRFGTGAAFSGAVHSSVVGGPLVVRDAVRGLSGVALYAPVVLANDVEVDGGSDYATFAGTVDASKMGRQSLTVTASGTTTFEQAVGGQTPLGSLLTRGIAPIDIPQSDDSKTIPLHYLPEFTTSGQSQVKYGIDVAVGNNPSQIYEFDTGGSSFFAGYNPDYWRNVPLSTTAIANSYSSGIYYNGVVSNAPITIGRGSQTVSTGQPIQVAAILAGGNAKQGTVFDFANPDAPPVDSHFFGDFGANLNTTPVPGLPTPLTSPLFQLPGNLSSGFLVQLGPIGTDPSLTVGVTDALRAQFPFAVPVEKMQSGGTYPVSGYDLLNWLGFSPSYTAAVGFVTEQIGATPTLPTVIDSGAPSTGIRVKGQGGDPFNVDGQLAPGVTFTATFPTTAGRLPLKWAYQAGNSSSVDLINYQQGASGGSQNVNTGLNLYNAFDVMFDLAEAIIWLRPTGAQATVNLKSVTTTGSQTYEQVANLDGAYTTGGGDFSVGGSTGLLGSTVVSAGSGDVTFSGTVDSYDTRQSLIVNSTGTTAFGRPVGGLQPLAGLLTDTGGFTRTAAVYTEGDQTYNDPVALANQYSAGGSFTAAGPATLVAPVALSGGEITFSGAIESTPNRGYSLTLTPARGKTARLSGDIGAAQPLGGLSIQAQSDGNASVIAPGNVVLSGDLGFSADKGLVIGPNVSATFTGGGVIRNFSGDGVAIGAASDDDKTVQRPVINNFAISGNGRSGNGGAGIHANETYDGLFESNAILNNAGSGVLVEGGTGNQILSNSISGNSAGITLTDGANNDQQAPIDVSAAMISGTELTVNFAVPSQGQRAGLYTVQVFYSPAATTGSVQGLQLLTTYDYVPAGPAVTQVITVPSTVAIGGYVTVTATSANGDTSPFSTAAAFSGFDQTSSADQSEGWR